MKFNKLNGNLICIDTNESSNCLFSSYFIDLNDNIIIGRNNYKILIEDLQGRNCTLNYITYSPIHYIENSKLNWNEGDPLNEKFRNFEVYTPILTNQGNTGREEFLSLEINNKPLDQEPNSSLLVKLIIALIIISFLLKKYCCDHESLKRENVILRKSSDFISDNATTDTNEEEKEKNYRNRLPKTPLYLKDEGNFIPEENNIEELRGRNKPSEIINFIGYTGENSSSGSSHLKEISIKNSQISQSPLLENQKSKLNKSSSPIQEEEKISKSPKIITNQDLEKIFENNRFTRTFKEIQIIGSGGFASVYKATSIVEDQVYAIKKIKLFAKPTDLSINIIFREVRVLAKLYKLKHKNLISYVTQWLEKDFTSNYKNPKEMKEDLKDQSEDSSSREDESSSLGVEWVKKKDSSKSSLYSNSNSQQINSDNTQNQEINMKFSLYIQMEFCSGNSLKEFINNRTSIDEKMNMNYFMQIIEGVSALHQEGVIHRDLKPANILMNETNCIRISDFGLSCLQELPETVNNYNEKPLKGSKTNNVGTYFYMAPELQKGNLYDEKIDMYSVGIILLELFTTFITEHERCKVLNKVSKKGQIGKIFGNKYVETKKLIELLINHDPKKRPPAQDVLQMLKYNPKFAIRND